jgi:hypothetical protein
VCGLSIGSGSVVTADPSPKRRRRAALQDARARFEARRASARFWSAAAPCRFSLEGAWNTLRREVRSSRFPQPEEPRRAVRRHGQFVLIIVQLRCAGDGVPDRCRRIGAAFQGKVGGSGGPAETQFMAH